MKSNTRHLVLCALFTATGVLLPVLFHGIGLGPMFLPMFWPLAIGSFFLPLHYAVFMGIATPILSFITTGMPPVSPPILYLMIVELAFMTGAISVSFLHFRLPPVAALLIGIVIERIVLFLLSVPLAAIIGLPPKLASFAVVLRGTPGLAALLIIVPLVVGRLKR